MAGSLELHGVEAGRLGEPVERVVPRQRMRPLVAEGIGRLRLAHVLVEPDDEPLPPPNALPEDRVREPSPYGGRDREGAAEGCPVTAEDGEVVTGGVFHPRILARPTSRARLRLPPQNRARHGPATEPRTLFFMPPRYAPANLLPP